MESRVKTVDEAFDKALVSILTHCPDKIPDDTVSFICSKGAFVQFYHSKNNDDVFGHAFESQLAKKWRERKFIFIRTGRFMDASDDRFNLIFRGVGYDLELLAQTQWSRCRPEDYHIHFFFYKHRSPNASSFCVIC